MITSRTTTPAKHDMSYSNSILSFYMYGKNPELKAKFESIPAFLPEVELRGYESLIPEGETPLWLYWKEYVFDYLYENKSTETIKAVLNALRFIVRQGRLYTTADVNTPIKLKLALQEQSFKRDWKGTGSFNTYRKNIGIYFKWLEDNGLIRESKIYNVRKLQESEKSRPYFSEEEIIQIRRHLKARECEEHEYWRNLLFFELAINTSSRVGELLKLKLEDISCKNGEYSIMISGDKTNCGKRPFFFPRRSREFFENYLTIRKKSGREDEQHLFLSRRIGKKWTYNSGVQRLCKQLGEELGFKINMHMFRRAGATILDLKGTSLERNMQQLRHTRPSTTASYIQPSAQQTKENVQILDNLR